ncbi:metal ABC transporter ATP-binding protein [Liquorilactobacillus capillatus]|uniref:ABC transporter ATP-binding protein n=1 Tax=Liquorilactobacillus capillatus DSM 19910 TaxID=1423731 RepID=A0A0R1M229_9LACO|nr:ATP-binding cassette domain-containing protein [Liquorilactobacillus capillatus]KRL01998.1 ABC transporter ATP-binding protein [Liquorilactobacillus capillatus DSM 19910]
MNSIINVHDLDLSVQGKQLFKNLTFEIPTNKLTCITGENGVGKTTLIKYLLSTFEHPDNHITLDVAPKETQYVPQLRNLDDEFPLSIRDFVGLGLKKAVFPWHTAEERLLLRRVLDETSLKTIQNRPLGAASGGEKQRAFLAQALCAEPQLLILDESTASLDKDSKYVLMDLIEQLVQTSEITVLFITHDPDLITRYADYELRLAHQKGHLLRKDKSSHVTI